MTLFEPLIARHRLVVLDGAFGTEAGRRGFDTNDELWSAKALYERPELVREIHRDYYAAGADVCSSASYQATVEGFGKKGFSREESAGLIRRSVELVRLARDEEARRRPAGLPAPLAAASVGPYGAYLADGSEYTGDYSLSEAELRDFHAERLAILASARPDLFAVETIPLLSEARAVMRELARYPEIPAWVCFSCRDPLHTCGGDPVSECARMLDSNPQVAAVGVNCTAPLYVEQLIREIRSATSKPVAVYPNTGETYDPQAKAWLGAACPYQDYVRAWYRAGARLIGGCCRTTPGDIARIARFRDSLCG